MDATELPDNWVLLWQRFIDREPPVEATLAWRRGSDQYMNMDVTAAGQGVVANLWAFALEKLRPPVDVCFIVRECGTDRELGRACKRLLPPPDVGREVRITRTEADSPALRTYSVKAVVGRDVVFSVAKTLSLREHDIALSIGELVQQAFEVIEE